MFRPSTITALRIEAFTPSTITDVQALYERVQDWIFKIDVGEGLDAAPGSAVGAAAEFAGTSEGMPGFGLGGSGGIIQPWFFLPSLAV